MTTEHTARRIAVGLLTAGAFLLPSLHAAPTAAVSGGSGVSPEIPRDFALDHGLRDHGSDGGRRGPSKQVRGLHLDPCGDVSWKPKRRSDRMAVRNFGPESLQVRELLTFRGASRAARVVARVRDDLAGCPDGTVDSSDQATRVKVFGLTTGWDDVVWSVTAADEQIGGYVAQVMRVGKAVVLNYDAGEYSRTTTRPGARALNRDSQDFAPLLCRWTAAGC